MPRELLVPDDVYLDTDVIVKAIFGGMDHSEACLSACSQLVDAGTSVYFSQLVRVEYAQALRSLATKAQLSDDLREQFDLDRWHDRMVRDQWFAFGVRELAVFLNTFAEVVEIPFSHQIWISSIQFMARYALRSHDAVHVATVQYYRIPVLWSCDDHFRRIDVLNVQIIRDAS